MFDLGALLAQLNARCAEKGLTLSGAAQQIGPSASTLKAMAGRSAVEADGVLQVLRWLNASPEDFYSNSVRAALPRATSGETIRIDAVKLHAALDESRRERGTTWTSIASELRESPSSITRLARGGRVTIQMVAKIAAYCRKPISKFIVIRRS